MKQALDISEAFEKMDNGLTTGCSKTRNVKDRIGTARIVNYRIKSTIYFLSPSKGDKYDLNIKTCSRRTPMYVRSFRGARELDF